MAAEKAFCPNCLGEATKIGNEITCLACDAIFMFNKKGEPKVKQIGIAERLDRIEDFMFKLTVERLDRIPVKEQAQPQPEPEPEPRRDREED